MNTSKRQWRGEAVPLSIYNPQPNNGLVVIGGDLSCMGNSKCISINHILALHAYQNYVKQEKILILPKFQPKKKNHIRIHNFLC